MSGSGGAVAVKHGQWRCSHRQTRGALSAVPNHKAMECFHFVISFFLSLVPRLPRLRSTSAVPLSLSRARGTRRLFLPPLRSFFHFPYTSFSRSPLLCMAVLSFSLILQLLSAVAQAEAGNEQLGQYSPHRSCCGLLVSLFSPLSCCIR